MSGKDNWLPQIALKPTNEYMREIQVNSPQLLTFSQTITHAGFERDIISRKPTVYDDDGYEIDSEDEDEEAQAALAAAAQFYPYSDVKLESERLFHDYGGCQRLIGISRHPLSIN
jgi:hypothetical protein